MRWKEGYNLDYLIEYDESNPISIEKYAQRLIGKTFADVCNQDDLDKSIVVHETSDYETSHENKKRKGGLGEIIEERFFHYQCNNDSRPDFYKAGVELKVTPYKVNKNGTLVAKERLIITMIDYFSVIEETFESSHMWNKAKLILLIYYLYQQEIQSRLDYRIGYAKLFSPPEADIKIIKNDFEIIVEKIKAGKAHELSEGDTMYLGAAPKAATSKDRRKQPFSNEPAKPRAFAFKNSYMTYVLNNYIVPGKDTSFGAIWDILDDISRNHNAYLKYVAALFFRMGYMHEYKKIKMSYDCEIVKISKVGEKIEKNEKIQLEWYAMQLEEDVWYTLNDKMGWINLGNNQVISFEGFIKLVDLLFQNEDCKYYYKNIVIDKKDKYKLSSGRTNSSAANLFILNYLEGNVKLSKLLDAFQKSRGVPMIKKSDYSVVTDKIVINVDIESR